MTPFTWAEFSKMHPFAPVEQAQGYKEMMEVSEGREEHLSPDR